MLNRGITGLTPPPTNRPMIGVLAGMGPRSTTPFLEALLDECVRQYGATADADFPPIMIHSIPTPFRLEGPQDHDGMRRTIRAGIERVAATGVGMIAVPCNVAHLYFEDITAGIGVPVLHLIDVTVEAIPSNAGTVVVLATRSTMKAGLYQTALRARGLGIAPSDEHQEAVDRIIRGVKESRSDERLRSEWDVLADRLRATGADCVVLGSTDLSGVASAKEGLRIVDSSVALARRLVACWRSLLEGASA